MPPFAVTEIALTEQLSSFVPLLFVIVGFGNALTVSETLSETMYGSPLPQE